MPGKRRQCELWRFPDGFPAKSGNFDDGSAGADGARPSGLLSVECFAAQRIGSIDDVGGNIRAPRTQLEAELPMVDNLSAGKVIRQEVDGEFLVPGTVDGDHFRVGFVAVQQQLNLARAIPREVKRSRGVAEILAVDLYKCALGVGMNGHAAVNTACVQAAKQQNRQQQSQGHPEASRGELRMFGGPGEHDFQTLLSDAAAADLEHRPFAATVFAVKPDDCGGARHGQATAGADQCVVQFERLNVGFATFGAF